MRFLEYLLEKDLINVDTCKKAKEKDNPIDYLYKSSAVSKKIIISEIEDFFKIEYIDLSKVKIDRDYSDLAPDTLMIKYNLILFGKESNVVMVAICEPHTFELDEDLSIALHPYKFKKYFAFNDEIIKKRDEGIIEKEVFDVVEENEKKQSVSKDNEKKHTVSKDNGTSKVGNDVAVGDVVKIVNDVVKIAIDQNASDIHIEPLEDEVRIRLRIDGDLYVKKEISQKDYPNVVSRIKVMAELDPTEKRKSQDGKISNFNYNGDIYDLRVSTLYTIHGEKIVMRLMNKSTKTLNFTDLGFNEKEIEKINMLLSRQSGIFLITGETGSGKSTTLYAMLNKINAPDINISTIEDPVESSIKGVTQVQLNELAGITFTNTLRTFLRQDPDIIMLGEVRDLETADIAIKASNTGHYVLSTLHTNNTIATINRLISMGLEPYKISENISGIMSQKLVKKLCSHCKLPHEITTEEKTFITEIETKYDTTILDENNHFYTPNPEGCPHCNKGYKGRIVIAELLIMNERLNELVSNNANSADIRKEAIEQKDSFIPFELSGLEKSKKGYVYLADVIKMFKK